MKKYYFKKEKNEIKTSCIYKNNNLQFKKRKK